MEESKSRGLQEELTETRTRTHLAAERTIMAADRSLMAWTKMSLHYSHGSFLRQHFKNVSDALGRKRVW